MAVVVTRFTDDPTASSHKRYTVVEVLKDGVVEAQISGDEDGVVVDGTVTLDANAAIRGRVELTIAGEPDLIPVDSLSLLNVYGNEIRVSTGVEFEERTEVIRQGIYRIDQSVASSGTEGEQIRVSGQDRMSQFTGDDGVFEAAGQAAGGVGYLGTTDPLEIIEALMLDVNPDIEFDFSPIDVELPPLDYEEGEDRGEFMLGIAKALGCELYFDRHGVATLRKIPDAIAGNRVATVAEGEGGVLLSAERGWDREKVYNRVVVTGENPNSTDDVPRGEAIDDTPGSPTQYGGPFGQRTYTWASTFISTNDQADDAAQGILSRATGAPDVISFSAVPNPALAPSDVIRITREVLGINEDHVLDTVSLGLAVDAPMTCSTRAALIL